MSVSVQATSKFNLSDIWRIFHLFFYINNRTNAKNSRTVKFISPAWNGIAYCTPTRTQFLKVFWRMMNFYMSNKIPFKIEVFIAEVTIKWLFLYMNISM